MMRKIEDLEALKKEALELSKRPERNADFATAMEEIRSAYLRGTNSDVEIRIRREHISAFGFDNYAELFPRSDVEIEDCYKKAKSISREKIEEQIAEEVNQKTLRGEYGGEEQGTSRLPTKPKTQEEKLFARLESGNLGAEKGLAFSLLQTGLGLCENAIEMSYKAWQIGDCLVKKITEVHGVITDEDERDFYFNRSDKRELLTLEKSLSEMSQKDFARLVPQVDIADFEIREMLGLRITNNEIFRLVKEFVQTTGDRKSPIKKVDDDNWVRFGSLGEGVCKVKYLETGKYSSRNQHPERFYKFIFDNATALDFLFSVMLGLFDCRPPSYYQLKGGSQMVFRSIGWTDKPTHIRLEALCKIADFKTKNRAIQQRHVEAYLNELKKGGFLRDWEKRRKRISGSRKKEIWYALYKSKTLPLE